MNMRASGASELRKFSHLLILKPLFPSFCWYFKFFVSETYIFSGLQLHLHIHVQSMQFPFITYGIYKRQYADKTLTLRKYMYMRASGASELRKILYFHILKLLFLSIFCWYFSYFTYLSAYMYRQISKCTDKTPEKYYWGAGKFPPPPLWLR